MGITALISSVIPSNWTRRKSSQFLHLNSPSSPHSSSTATLRPRSYGATSVSGHTEESDDEDEEEIDWELEEQGFYRGSYSRKVALYTIVPVASALTLALLATLPHLFYKHKPFPHKSQLLPSPLAELLVATSLWCLSYLLRVPIYTSAIWLASLFSQRLSEPIGIILSTVLHTGVRTFLRLAAYPLLHLHLSSNRQTHSPPKVHWHDPSFTVVWWLALGSGLAETIVVTVQGYEQLSLYRDVLVPGPIDVERLMESIDSLREHSESENVQVQVDQDLDRLVAIKAREELEEVYGMPVIKIPVFVSYLERLTSLILGLGLSLLLSAAYLRSSLSLPIPKTLLSTLSPSLSPSLRTTLILVFSFNLFISLLHTPLILPRIGLHTAAYVGLLVGLGALFIGLGEWGIIDVI